MKTLMKTIATLGQILRIIADARDANVYCKPAAKLNLSRLSAQLGGVDATLSGSTVE